MSRTEEISKGTSMSEIQEAIFGKEAKKELTEMGLGCLTTAHIDAEVSGVHLIPVKQRASVNKYLKSLLSTAGHRNVSDGYYFVPRIVQVTIAHVQAEDGAVMNSRLTDTARIDLSPLDGQVHDIVLSGNPCITVFFPTYSIPNQDKGNGDAKQRNLVMINRVVGGRIATGNSVCSTFLLWMPEFSMKPHSYNPRKAINVIVKAGVVEGPFNGGMTPLMFVKAACENSFAETGKTWVPKGLDFSKRGIGGQTSSKKGRVTYKRGDEEPVDAMEDWDARSAQSDVSQRAYVDLGREEVLQAGKGLGDTSQATN